MESEFRATKFYTDFMLLMMFECQNYCNTDSFINFGNHFNNCKWQLSDRMTFFCKLQDIHFTPVKLDSATDTWDQLVSITLNHKTCIKTSRQVLERPYSLSMLSLHKITIFQNRN